MTLKIKQILILMLGVTFLANAQERQPLDQVLAVVGSNVVLLSEVENQYLQMQAQGATFESDGKCKVFEELLYQKLLLNQAKLDSVEVSEKEIDATLDGRIDMMASQIGGIKELEKYFGKSIHEIKDEFRDIISDQLITQRMQTEITAEIVVTPSEVRKFFTDLPKDSLPLVNAQYEVAQVVKYPEASKEAIQEVKDRLNDYKKSVEEGSKFSTYAVLYSEDPGSGKNGGELGFVSRTDLVPEFAAAAFSLKEGEVSRIVKTEFGYHIIQLIEQRGEQVNVRHILLKPKISSEAKMKVKTELDSIRNEIKTDTLTFEQAAYFYSDDEKTKNNNGLMVNPYTGASKFETSQLDPGTNYAIRTMEVGDISEPFESVDAKGKTVYKIVMLKARTKPHVINMKDDYQQIQDMAMAKKSEKVVKEWIIEKQKSSYIRIDESFRNCDFDLKGWVK